jgi:uncharacterized protein involved in exopolysaccharide biosynthesis
VLLQLWRAKWLMFLVFLPIALAGIALMLLLPAKYPASARLLVWPVQESGSAAMPRQEALQAEAELARSPVIAERVIKRIGLQRLYPDIADAQAKLGGDANRRELDAFARDLSVSVSSRSSILTLSYQHTDPQLAADTVNALVNEYLTYRRGVLAGGDVERLGAQRNAAESRLKVADEALRAYLGRNNLVDLETETSAAAHLVSEISGELSSLEADQREAEARADGLRRQMQAMPREAELYVESASAQQLEQLRLERQDLLARYRPDSRAVQDMDKRIAQLETYVGSSPAGGLRRIGPNPAFRALEASAAAEAANIVALGGRARELARQRELAGARVSALAALAPEYQRLKRDRDALASQAAEFAAREQEENVHSEVALGAVDNVSVYEPARTPSRDSSTNSVLAVSFAAFGALVALAAGLLGVWSVRTFPTAGAVERTLGLRVLAAARNRSQP